MDKVQHHKTAAKDKVSLKHKLGFGLGAANECILANAIINMSSYVFNIALGVSPVLIGIAGAVPRLWEAITDPAIGSMSDNYRSRFGRRKPFIAIGAIFAAVIFAAIWFVPTGWSERAYFYWLLAGSILFFTGYALFNIPWNAMGYEMTPDYHERTKVMAYRSVFSSLGSLLLPWLFALAKLSCFKDTLEGARYVGVGTAILMIILGLMPVLLGKENYSVQVERQEKIPLMVAIRASLKNVPFMAIVGSVTLMTVGVFTVMTMGPYLTIYYVLKGNQQAASIVIGWGGTSYGLISLAATPVIAFVSSKIGKRNALQAFLGLALVGCFSKWFCYNQSNPYLTIVPNLLIGPGFAAVWMLCHAMIADICDVDELKTSTRREGFYGAVYNWALKLGVTGATGLSGLVLVVTGFNQALGDGQSPHTLYLMRIFFVAIPAVANIAAMILLGLYNITEDKAYQIRTELEERRGVNEVSNILPVDSVVISD
ncbi:MAG: MFS transporter [Armatimonadota bacterium]